MIDDVPDDSVNTKRWFNDVREVPFSGFFDGFFVGLDVFLRYRDALTAGQVDFTGEGGRFWKGFNGFLDLT